MVGRDVGGPNHELGARPAVADLRSREPGRPDPHRRRLAPLGEGGRRVAVGATWRAALPSLRSAGVLAPRWVLVPDADRSSEWAWLRHSCLRHAIRRLAEETEGVTSRVEHDPNGFLRLNLGRARTARDGPLDCVDQFVDPDVKVLRCDLALRLGGPKRSLPLLLELEIQSEVGSLHLSPTRIRRFAWTRRIGRGDRCMQEVRVELRELARSRSPERDGRQSDRRLVRLRHEIQFRIRSARRAHLPRPWASAHLASRMANPERTAPHPHRRTPHRPHLSRPGPGLHERRLLDSSRSMTTGRAPLEP